MGCFCRKVRNFEHSLSGTLNTVLLLLGESPLSSTPAHTPLLVQSSHWNHIPASPGTVFATVSLASRSLYLSWHSEYLQCRHRSSSDVTLQPGAMFTVVSLLTSPGSIHTPKQRVLRLFLCFDWHPTITFLINIIPSTLHSLESLANITFLV